MKRIKIIIFLPLLLNFNLNTGFCQIWTGSQPMYYNPSFAGSGDGLRLACLTKYTFSTPQYTERMYNNISGDIFVSKLSTGIGFYIDYGVEASGSRIYRLKSRKSFSSGIAFAPKISISGKFTISPAIEANFNHVNQVDLSDYIIPDRYENLYYELWGFRCSVLFNTKKLYLGYTFNFYNQNIEYLRNFAQDSRNQYYMKQSPVRYSTIQAGYSFEKSDNSNLTFTPQIVMNIGDRYPKKISARQIDLNARYKKFLTGISYSRDEKQYYLPESLGLILGIQTNRFRIAFINSKRFSDILVILPFKSMFTSSISIRYQFKNKHPEKQHNNFISQK